MIMVVDISVTSTFNCLSSQSFYQLLPIIILVTNILIHKYIGNNFEAPKN